MKRDVAIKILQILQEHRRIRKRTPKQDYSINPFIDLMIPLIENDQPLKMLLLGYPCKSINPDSVLGTTPDGGEEEGLKNLGEICEDIKSVYKGGCELLIVNDAHFYTDIKIVPSDEVIDEYENCLHKMTSNPMIHFTNILSDFSSDYQEARSIVFGKYMLSEEAVRAAVLEKEWLRNILVTYKTFITHEYASQLMPGSTKSEIKKRSKELTYQWIQRYLVLNQLCTELFSGYFRLSILAYQPHKKSFGINLIPKTSEYGKSWYNVLVKNADGSVMLMKKKKAEEAGYKLVYKDGKPWYFVNDQT
jgi:L-tyrosine isonitrile synthase